MKIAAIDIGSNSIHMVVARIGRGGFEIIDREKEMIGLARGTLVTGELSPAAQEAGFQTIASFKRIAERQGADPILAVATSAIREAKNGGDFALRVWEQLGLRIEVITGSEEGRLIFLAAQRAIGFRGHRPIVVDVGGGSVELVFASGGEIRWQESLKLGVTRLTERFLRTDPPEPREVSRLEAHAKSVLAPVFRRARRDRPTLLVGTSGTLLNLTAMAAALRSDRPPSRLHNLPLRRAEVAKIRALVLERSSEEREGMPGLDRKRIDLIPAGAVLADVILSGLEVSELRSCEWALREGILLDFIAKNREVVRAANRVPDLRRRSVLALAERFRSDEAHSRQVARLALALFDATRRIHKLDLSARELLEFAALLHDVGLYVSHSKHHRHSHYLITNGQLRGFTPEEIQVMAAVARYHKGAPPKGSQEEMAELSPQARRLVTRLAAILRVADSLDRGHHGIVRGLRIARRDGRVEVFLDTSGRDAEFELWGARRKSELWERCFDTEIEFRVSRG